MASWPNAIVALQGVVLLAFVVFGLWRGARGASTWLLAGAMGGPGLYMVTLGTTLTLGVFKPALLLPLALLYCWLMASTLAFAIVYPSPRPPPRVAWAAAWAFVPAATLTIAALVDRPLFVGADGATTPAMGDILSYLTMGPYVLAALVLGWKWARAQPGPYRGQFLFVLLAILFFTINDGMGLLLHAWLGTLGPNYPQVPLHNLPIYALAVVVGVGVAGISVRRLLTRPRDETREDRQLIVGVLLMLPFSLIQAIPPITGLYEDGATLHLLTDAAILPILGYGALRYQILDIDLKVKTGIRRGTLAAVGLAILLVVQQLVEQYVGSLFGALGGALVAGTLLFLLTPLQDAARRLSDRAMPRVSASEAYLHFRRMEVYRAALEGVLREGHASAKRAGALVNLRATLNVTEEEHDLLERDIRERLASASA